MTHRGYKKANEELPQTCEHNQGTDQRQDRGRDRNRNQNRVQEYMSTRVRNKYMRAVNSAVIVVCGNNKW